MKKNFFLAILCLLIAGSVSAQRRYYHSPRSGYNYNNNDNSDFYTPSVGFEIGANVSNMVSSNSDYNTGSLAGLNIGLTFDLPIIYPVSFAPEVLFSQKGYTATTTDGNFTQRTNYIDVPLLFKFKAAPAFNIYIGPQLSYLVSTTNTYDNGFETTSEQYYESNNGHKSYLDGVLGISFDLSRNVDLHARYTIDLQKTDYQGNTYVPNYQNQVWQFGIGFKFK
ncbi:PorT family protein [Mucilaginibacter corticis]|uniref:PorT family protein n=1 Tax=Mucilaginibacter corticis TaxID=2597670 RepID=A0A556MFR2_9SPHI|nr:porin family protein [Mucilaginibacter corticis]TSJ38733.1 PorT family protein [Mucilaginibacter corticis]